MTACWPRSPGRNPRTKATVDQLLERYLDQFDGAESTKTLYRGCIRKHISPYLGRLKIGALDADVLDSFYAELRRCRDHCSGRPGLQHRTAGEHQCDDRCGPHQCRPLNASTIRHMHFILSGAYKRAVRWRWVSASPIAQAEPPSAPKPNPQPPTPGQAARIVNAASRDPDWGTLVWVAMTTGARRGELCALRWSAVSLVEGRETMWLRRAIRKTTGGLVEGDLKTHQQHHRHVLGRPHPVLDRLEEAGRCPTRPCPRGRPRQRLLRRRSERGRPVQTIAYWMCHRTIVIRAQFTRDGRRQGGVASASLPCWYGLDFCNTRLGVRFPSAPEYVLTLGARVIILNDHNNAG